MEKKETGIEEGNTVDVAYLFKVLLKRAWAILAISVIFAGMMFGYTKLFVKDRYSSNVMLYVNNRGSGSISDMISVAELSAAQSLVDTYSVILKSRTTMTLVGEKVKENTGIEVNWQSIQSSVNVEHIEGTEIFKITVITEDPKKSADIATAVIDVLKVRIDDIVSGDVKVVDKPSISYTPIPRDTAKNTMIGFTLGLVLSCGLFMVLALLDDTIRDEDYIMQTFDKPILAQVPDLMFDDKTDLRYDDYVKAKKAAEYK